ncbi:MAG: ammonium transporter [Kiritimatiellia bacterium]
MAAGGAAWAQDTAAAPDVSFTANNLWMMVCTMLVFVMNLGFATVETGLTRAKNTVNILFKNTIIPAIGLLSFAAIGFGLMYPGEGGWIVGKLFGFKAAGLHLPADGLTGTYNPGMTYWTDFLFQAMFAATAATIVSGAVAERVKLGSFLIFTLIYVTFVYPLVGSWTWGGGWLAGKGFHDFAGSTLVHSVGGWAALAGAIVLGPRIGRFVNGMIKAAPGHNLPLATIGVFLLWLGWFGFNGGSVLTADPGKASLVLLTTNLSAAAGMVTAMLTSWTVQKKPDLTMVLNGCLAGLVAVTAGADCVSPGAAVAIGAIGGVLVVFAVLGVDRLRVDDPVGAISVHLVNGVWGTLAVGLFSPDYGFMTQLLGVAAYGAACLPVAFLVFYLIKKTMGLRVPADEELRGLDIGEHGQEAYGGFQIFTTV